VGGEMAVDEKKAEASGSAGGKGEEPKRDNFWLYVWLGISGLLNISGMASIVDGFVTWAKFFREFIDAYRWAIRDPLAYVGNAVWPFGRIPGWVFDVFVLWSALFLAYNIFLYLKYKRTAFSNVRIAYQESFSEAALVAFFSTILLPILLLIGSLGPPSEREDVRKIVKNFAFILGLFILMLLVNWQLKKLA
jgi:hypothetical protein